jgi:uncharacterized protein YdeI (YjbR/CyaY-like superfamily)
MRLREGDVSEVYAGDAREWEAWLEEHHERETEVWLVYWKKASGKASVAWAEAVEVALKFGWIDGLIASVDEHRYKQRWTPRRPKSRWSLVNKNIVLRHLAAGELRPSGLAAMEAAKAIGEWDRAYTVQRPTPTPDDLKARLRASPAARAQQQRVSHTRWNRWLAWLEGTEGRARSRRLNMIVAALEAKDHAAVDAACARMRS